MSKVTTIVENEDDKEVGEKVYHFRFPGSTFVSPDGTTHASDGKGELRTKSLLLQKELDKIVDKAGSIVFTKDYIPQQNETKPVEDIKARAAAVQASISEAQRAAIK